MLFLKQIEKDVSLLLENKVNEMQLSNKMGFCGDILNHEEIKESTYLNLVNLTSLYLGEPLEDEYDSYKDKNKLTSNQVNLSSDSFLKKIKSHFNQNARALRHKFLMENIEKCDDQSVKIKNVGDYIKKFIKEDFVEIPSQIVMVMFYLLEDIGIYDLEKNAQTLLDLNNMYLNFFTDIAYELEIMFRWDISLEGRLEIAHDHLMLINLVRGENSDLDYIKLKIEKKDMPREPMPISDIDDFPF